NPRKRCPLKGSSTSNSCKSLAETERLSMACCSMTHRGCEEMRSDPTPKGRRSRGKGSRRHRATSPSSNFQHSRQECQGLRVNLRILAFPRPRHIQDADPILLQPFSNRLHSERFFEVEAQARLAEAAGDVQGQRGASLQGSAGQDQGAVRVADVPFRALRV